MLLCNALPPTDFVVPLNTLLSVTVPEPSVPFLTVCANLWVDWSVSPGEKRGVPTEHVGNGPVLGSEFKQACLLWQDLLEPQCPGGGLCHLSAGAPGSLPRCTPRIPS